MIAIIETFKVWILLLIIPMLSVLYCIYLLLLLTYCQWGASMDCGYYCVELTFSLLPFTATKPASDKLINNGNQQETLVNSETYSENLKYWLGGFVEGSSKQI